MLKKLIVILGPTTSGKSELGVKLAKKFNGEIVSADSRQVYKGMNLGTGKITKKEMIGIPHHLLDVVSPKRRFSAAQYQKLAIKAINRILKKKKIPFLVGGSPFYIYSIVEGWQFPKLKPNWKLRKKLEKKSVKELFEILKKLDSERAKTIEKNNKRRLIRAIEIAKKIGKVPKLIKKPQFKCLILGIKKPKEELKKLIEKRLLKRIKKGLINEVKKLKKQGISWKRLESFGLEYKWIAYYLQKKLSYQEMILKLQKDIEHFAKRQMTWFKKDKRIYWVKNKKEAEKLTKDFLKK
ncbi:tRNA (adenosine(37)-N6)-dimethylallyltransferase MiaA [bacterium (Candidatus Gribaldobacteria) CG07_land_8_20_14_0_80_33_18]|uniref:tRNA dimethylallyltransferase n=1 Tax=bacterium (Candidatus Gribaldobacteria) CG07_land_8_20_14_0_80_33_18 TaxID=2014272 RepID=A0A2M6Z201_9BACT|nr:MAG: tRNA (adenosine(37)-N6)-dimethylallyltransferase MiaA [bacterium (Candidatus Gribaldobacteria) CG10_big_fil_rev_8_21_14_0_10_33_41]PIU46347.1 MAG: tRNA (adenosine(37)-N6)-dimethylallyltransferase MiaA [bacterium (Candidatus Gribaldobacteria) CG07_land_8_20_14_0_80_33_18]PJA00650.1 MAG: tRNA (adenosine(37)-N6)-dimethylallyltransferase MiaA [bacterium (Candidatus Gribaldobacteria) CG_4_10_14_0_2_um_filter_33_15]PJB09059.1 MAG: tRNA (adenosine(37)-N6)-dimethylallyltransferase MiaA [bacteriu